MNLTSHLHLVMRLRIHGTIPLLPYASMACTSTTVPLPFTKQILQHLTMYGTILNIVRNDKCTSLTVDTYLTVIW